MACTSACLYSRMTPAMAPATAVERECAETLMTSICASWQREPDLLRQAFLYEAWSPRCSTYTIPEQFYSVLFAKASGLRCSLLDTESDGARVCCPRRR